MTELTDRLDGASNVLLEVPPMGAGRDVCTSLLTGGVETPNVLFVTFTRQPEACLDQLADAAVGDVAVVTVGDTVPDVDRQGVETDNVGTPSDLTGLGITIGQYLSEWGEGTVICFESLTSMLQYVDFETAYEFLHAITGQVYAADARAHFHIDPSAHDDTEIAGITSLFDASVDADEGDVRTRDVIS